MRPSGVMCLIPGASAEKSSRFWTGFRGKLSRRSRRLKGWKIILPEKVKGVWHQLAVRLEMGHFTSEELRSLVCEVRMVGKHLDPRRSQSIFIDRKEKKVDSDMSFF